VERLLQYLDDLDDAYGMVGLINERLRRALFAFFSYITVGTVAAAAIWLALAHPPIALATSILLFVTLLYRSVTSPLLGRPRTA
jgi:hypothetical protein